jgi:hypothetical protein
MAEVSVQPPRAGADRAPAWSWFTAIEPAAQSVVHPTSRAQPNGETPRHGRIHTASQPTTNRQSAAGLSTAKLWSPLVAN